MAATYSIILNLSGNALSASARLAMNLERANVAATALAANLRAVGAASHTISRTGMLGAARGGALTPTRAAGARTAASAAAVARTRGTIPGLATTPSAYVASSPGLMLMRQGALNRQGAQAITGRTRGFVTPPGYRGVVNPNPTVAPAPRAPRVAPAPRAPRVAPAPRAPRVAPAPAPRTRGAQPAFFGGTGIGGNFGRILRLVRLMTPGDGQMFGMNAATLSKNLNIAGLVGSLLMSVGKMALKTIMYTSLAPYVVGGIGLSAMMSYVQGENFASGVRMIARRRQAKLGLGENYEAAENASDYISSAYGLERSTTLSSINVLTGLGIGGTDRKVTLQQAAALTKVGGIISQTNGVPFERVMTNIQQLLVQQTPNMRDIRELLNQAPILGKYALRDMEAKNVKGVDVRTYLKDQGALLSVLKRYELDTATNAGMQARGQLTLAKQDFHTLLAGNEKVWRYTGNAGEGFYKAMGTAVNKLLTTLVEDRNFRIMVEKLNTTLINFAEHVDQWLPVLNEWVLKLQRTLGVGDESSEKAVVNTTKRDAIEAAFRSPDYRKTFAEDLEYAGYFKDIPKLEDGSYDLESYNKALDDAIEQRIRYVMNYKYMNGISMQDAITSPIGGYSLQFEDKKYDIREFGFTEKTWTSPKLDSVPNGSKEDLSWEVGVERLNRMLVERALTTVRNTYGLPVVEEQKDSMGNSYNMYTDQPYIWNPYVEKERKINIGGFAFPAGKDVNGQKGWRDPDASGWLFGGNEYKIPNVGYESIRYGWEKNRKTLDKPNVSVPAMGVNLRRADEDTMTDFLRQLMSVGKIDDNLKKDPVGDDVTGAGKDRRALEIHFHDKLVEWNSTFSSDDPEETVQVVARDIELITAAAIQKAMLGASNKMSSQWY